MKIKQLILIIHLFSFGFCYGITKKDSLIQLVDQDSDSRTKFDYLYTIASLSSKENAEEFRKWADRAWIIAGDLENDSLKIKMHILEGNAKKGHQDNEDTQVSHLFKAVELAEKIGDSLSMSEAHYGIGVYYFWKKNMEKSLYYVKMAMNSYPDSAPILKKSTYIMAYGIVLQDNDPEASVPYHEKALQIKRDAKAWRLIPISLNNLAELKVELGDTMAGIKLLEESISLSEEHRVEDAWVYAEFVLGDIWSKKKEYRKAIPYFQKAIVWWEENDYLKDLPRAYRELGIAYRETGNYKNASEAWEKYIAVSEKLFKKEQLNAVEDIETKYKTEKKELELKQERREKNLAKRETDLVKANEKTRLILFSVIGVLLIGGGVHIYLLYRKQKRGREIIADQKVQLEIRNQEVEDSIVYAKRIQNAILPSENQLSKDLPEHFILYKPKDIIAGDFYWSYTSDKTTFLAVADCTGQEFREQWFRWFVIMD